MLKVVRSGLRLDGTGLHARFCDEFASRSVLALVSVKFLLLAADGDGGKCVVLNDALVDCNLGHQSYRTQHGNGYRHLVTVLIHFIGI